MPSHIDFVLYESALGYAVFEVAQQVDPVAVKTKDFQRAVEDLASFGKMVKLVNFTPFSGHIEAFENVSLSIDHIVSDQLKSVLELNLPHTGGKKAKVTLGVHDSEMAKAIKEIMPGLNYESSETSLAVEELLRGLRQHAEKLLKDLKPGDTEAAALAMSHAISRAKMKFNPAKDDTHIVQAISTLDAQDKGLNQCWMRLREWYSIHFPELSQVVSDNATYAKLILFIGNKERLNQDMLHDLAAILEDDVEKAQAIIDLAQISMGAEIHPDDLMLITALAGCVDAQGGNRRSTSTYLDKKMKEVAPNLQALIGTNVGARLIAQAGSLKSLAKSPASTIQIYGAEKALFRALKTKGNTPKYGILYHSPFIAKAGPGHKGRISRYVANKAAIASRIDSFTENPSDTIGLALKQQVEDRLDFFATGKKPAKNSDVMSAAMKEILMSGDSTAMDLDPSVSIRPKPTEESSGRKKAKKDKKKDKTTSADTMDVEPANGDRRKEKKEKKEKKRRLDEQASGEPMDVDLANGDRKKKKKKSKEVSV